MEKEPHLAPFDGSCRLDDLQRLGGPDEGLAFLYDLLGLVQLSRRELIRTTNPDTITSPAQSLPVVATDLSRGLSRYW
jgi:hypothetical protein